MMIYEPFVSLDSLRFGDSSEEVIGRWPGRKPIFDHYDSGFSVFLDEFTLTFEDKKLVEIGISGISVLMVKCSHLIISASNISELRKWGGEEVVHLGIHIFPAVGLTIADLDEVEGSAQAMTIFSLGRWDQRVSDIKTMGRVQRYI